MEGERDAITVVVLAAVEAGEPEVASVLVLVGLALGEALPRRLIVRVGDTLKVPAPQNARCRTIMPSCPSLRAHVITVAVYSVLQLLPSV